MMAFSVDLDNGFARLFTTDDHFCEIHFWLVGSNCMQRKTLRPQDEIEKKKIETFCEQGCGCPENCSANYTLHHYKTLRSQCSELDHVTLDMVIMGQIMALTSITQERRQTAYMHLGLKVINNQPF